MSTSEMTGRNDLMKAFVQPGNATFGQAAGQARNQVMRQQVLADDEQAIFHG